jgi:uncharacterized protein
MYNLSDTGPKQLTGKAANLWARNSDLSARLRMSAPSAGCPQAFCGQMGCRFESFPWLRTSKFGLAFCESSGKCLVRWTGTDPAMIELARKNALAIGARHSFIVFLADGFYPVNVLNAVKLVPEVCRIFCVTANPAQVLVAETSQGRGIVGVVDGLAPKGVEGEADIEWRKKLLRQIGYKL